MVPMRLTFKSIIDIPTLRNITEQCDRIHMGFIFKAAILLSYFSFLQISNLVPHSISTYNPLKQLARGDIFFFPPGAHIMLKWSKTLQMSNSLRKNFTLLLKKLNQNSKITFHSLRRSGATLAFNSKVSIQDIQSHGTWTSDCVWSYITQDHEASDRVALTFQFLLQP